MTQTFLDKLKAISLPDAIGILVAGGVNGLALMGLLQTSNYGFLGTAASGIVSYALTTFVNRMITLVIGTPAEKQAVKLSAVNWYHLIIAGTLNGFIFLGLLPYFSGGTAGQVLAGAISYYFLTIVTMLLALAA